MTSEKHVASASATEKPTPTHETNSCYVFIRVFHARVYM